MPDKLVVVALVHHTLVEVHSQVEEHSQVEKDITAVMNQTERKKDRNISKILNTTETNQQPCFLPSKSVVVYWFAYC